MFRLTRNTFTSNAYKRVKHFASSRNRSTQDVPLAQSSVEIVNSSKQKYKEGLSYQDFECVRVEQVEEFGISSYTFRHAKTGTELWNLYRNDENNVFSINFRTTPFDSTGLPHVLEHLVLCGSQQYPVRDPFFKMLNRSMATFMNAMTGPDYTMYPFSSMNEVDFRNLQKIYLDAVFRPNLKYLDFLQEGWRLEHSSVRDKNSEYTLKGVVYNEMKGAFSENSSIFGQNLLNNLLPDHTYGNVSGGNPLEIPKLTHDSLVNFHQKYYHPSNAKIYVYGSFDLDKTFELLNEQFLSKYNRIDNKYSSVPSQPRWIKPRNVHISSRFDTLGAPFEKQNQIAVAVLLEDITNVQETFVLYVLCELLIRGPNSPFYRNLIEPNFSGGYNQSTGYDPQVKDTYFVVGLQDVRVEDFSKFQSLYDQTIQEIVQNGFEPAHVESVLHNIELSLKHQNPQFGLSLLFNSTPLWNHGGDVVSSLRITQMITELRQGIRDDSKFLEKKVEKYFLNNSHKLTLTMSPDEHYEANFKTAELDLLKQKIVSLDHGKRQEIFENGIKLEEDQKSTVNVDVLPCLSIDDVKKAPLLKPFQVLDVKGVQTQICHVNTNNLTYLKIYFDGSFLDAEEIMLIPLFCNLIGDMGTSKHNYRDFDKLVLSKTAGIDFSLQVTENIDSNNTYRLGVLMRTHALDQNATDMLDLCSELLTSFNISDTERLQMLVDNYISGVSVGVAQSGHLYAMLSCAALLNDCAKLKSQLSGIEHIEYAKNYLKRKDLKQMLKGLQNLGKKLFAKNNMKVAFNSSDNQFRSLANAYESFLTKLPTNANAQVTKSVNFYESSNQYYVMNIPVHYCAKAFNTAPYIHPDNPTLRVLAKLISAKYLLPIVREQNGAYGAGAKLGTDGIFHFFSYRDPHSAKTLEVFDTTYEWLKQHNDEITEQVLFEAKLGVLQQLDAPVAPGNIGLDHFLTGVNNDMILKYRERVLAVTLSDLRLIIDKYFKVKPKSIGKCILGPANKDIEAQTNLKWNVTQ